MADQFVNHASTPNIMPKTSTSTPNVPHNVEPVALAASDGLSSPDIRIAKTPPAETTTNITAAMTDHGKNIIKSPSANTVGTSNGSGKKNLGDSSSPPRKSLRARHSPSLFIARPSKQGLGVSEGDEAFLKKAYGLASNEGSSFKNDEDGQLPVSAVEGIDKSGGRRLRLPRRSHEQESTTPETKRRRVTPISSASSPIHNANDGPLIESHQSAYDEHHPNRRRLPVRASRTRPVTPNGHHGLTGRTTQASNNSKLNNSVPRRSPTNIKSPPASASAAAAAAAASTSTPSSAPAQSTQTMFSGAPRPPRVIIIGAGIAGLACARELSERKYDVLVLEARNRLGGRLRTVDLMLDDGKDDEENTPHFEAGNNENRNESTSDLYKVKKWCPVDVGGAFIHGTGYSSTPIPSSHVGSHDFGTSGSSWKKSKGDQSRTESASKPLRKSERISLVYKQTIKGKQQSKSSGQKSKPAKGANAGSTQQSNLNPLYVLARQKLRLPLQAAEGAYTCLVDHNGRFISDQLDQQVSWEFNEILDLATRCCESGRYEWKTSQVDSLDPTLQSRRLENFRYEDRNKEGNDTSCNQAIKSLAEKAKSNETKVEGIPFHSTRQKTPETGVHATKIVETNKKPHFAQPTQIDDVLQSTISKVSSSGSEGSGSSSDCSNGSSFSNAENCNGEADIDPTADFGTIFTECKKYYYENMAPATRSKMNTVGNLRTDEDKVKEHLFQWHVANLEMSSGAPMHMLGQKWNDDEPYGYGGDHSYLEGGFRDVVEALAEGFECRFRRELLTDESVRRSGDLVNGFQRISKALSQTHHSMTTNEDETNPDLRSKRIECGIVVNDIRVVENDEVLRLRKRKRQRLAVHCDSTLEQFDEATLRRSGRANKGSKLRSYLDALTSRPHERQQQSPQQNTQFEPKSDAESSEQKSNFNSCYGNKENTVVRVTAECGSVFEADAVIVTVPLAILSSPPGAPGHISFNPPLPESKQHALSRLGVGAYNKCCMSFAKPFWESLPRHVSPTILPKSWSESGQSFDFIGHASSDHGKDILFFNLRHAPILIAIYGGSKYSNEVEDIHDEEVVAGCMQVLRKIFNQALDDSQRTRRQIHDLTVPDWPIDYFVSRWGSDPFSKGAFCYVPPGVDGFSELKAMSEPIFDFRVDSAKSNKDFKNRPKRPLIMFAGEATTPYHPSTIHGAFESGIREAYRLDLALEPDFYEFEFDESYMYQPTFSIRKGQASTKPAAKVKRPEPSIEHLQGDENGHDPLHLKVDQKHDTADCRRHFLVNDISILRGVESFTSSPEGLAIVKSKMIDIGNLWTISEVESRYKSLLNMIGSTKAKKGYALENETTKARSQEFWDLPGGRGSWLAPNDIGDTKNANEKTPDNKESKYPLLREDLPKEEELGLRRSSRKIRKKMFFDD